MNEFNIYVDFIPDRIEVYQLVSVWENKQKTEKPIRILKVDQNGKLLFESGTVPTSGATDKDNHEL